MITQTLVAVLSLAVALAVDFYVNSHPVEHPHLVSILAAAPSFLALGLVLFGNSFDRFLVWLVEDPAPCVFALYFIAVLPTACGLLIDVPLAYRAYAKRVGTTIRNVRSLPANERYAIAEYGDISSTEFKTGRYLPRKRFVVYSLLCNVAGVSCTVLLVVLASLIPDMHDYVVDSESWVNVLELCLSFSILSTLAHLYQEQTKPKPATVDLEVENPDMYRLSRLHTLANSIFLILHVALCAALVILFFFFGVTHFQGCHSLEALVCLSLVAIATLLFMWFASASPLARDFDAECGGLWKWGPFILAAAYVVLVLCLFDASAIIWWLVAAVVVLVVAARFIVKPLKSGFLAAIPVIMLVLTVVGVLVVFVS